MGGSFSSITASDLLFGFETNVTQKINGGDFFQGNDFGLQNTTTPIFNDLIGSVAESWYGVYTGSNLLSQTSRVRILNDEAYTNRIVPIWNGTYYSNVTLNPDGSVGFAQAQMFGESTSNGIQFPPFMDENVPIMVYNERNIEVNTYTHVSSSKIGSNSLQVDQFTCPWSAINYIGFAFDQDFWEASYMCGSCAPYGETRTFTVDGQQYVQATDLSDYYMTVQLDSGLMYQSKKDATVNMVIGGQLTGAFTNAAQPTPFPDLDPIYGMQIPVYDIS